MGRFNINILSTASIFLLIEKFAALHSVLSPEEVEKLKTGDLPTNFYSNTYIVVLIINDNAESVGLVYETSNKVSKRWKVEFCFDRCFQIVHILKYCK